MNKKRIVNALEIIIQAITVLLLFCKGMYIGYDGSKEYSLSFSDIKIEAALFFLIILILKPHICCCLFNWPFKIKCKVLSEP